MITTFGLVTITITAVFGFGNASNAYLQMGYSSIIWYALAGICFFFPRGLMTAEYGSTLKDVKGGIHSWLAGSVGERIAFVGTFVWLVFWIVRMVSTASRVWITFSALLSGKDTTQQWHAFGLTSTQLIGVLGILLILGTTWYSSQGVTVIVKVGSLGGILTIVVNIIFAVVSVIVLVVDKGILKQPIHGASASVISPNPQFQTPITIISSVVYAVFAYGGMESLGPVTDNMKNPEKTSPRELIIASIFIIGTYVLMIFMFGWSVNYQQTSTKSSVNLGSATYVVLNQLEVTMGDAPGWSHSAALTSGLIMTRIVALAQTLGFLGALFILFYSPIKVFILGSNPELWPKKPTEPDKAGMPINAMRLQVIIVSIIVFLAAFGGNVAQQFYSILTDMVSVSTCFLYIFLIGAFSFFKAKKDLNRPFVVFKNRFWTDILVCFAELILITGIALMFAQPLLQKDYQTTFWTLAGPIFFAIVALVFHQISVRRYHAEG